MRTHRRAALSAAFAAIALGALAAAALTDASATGCVGTGTCTTAPTSADDELEHHKPPTTSSPLPDTGLDDRQRSLVPIGLAFTLAGAWLARRYRRWFT